jgi:mono/diheme cytochrome c family protein
MSKCIKCIGALAVFGLIGGTLFIYSGWYNVAADDEHTAPVFWLLETIREQSIESASKDIQIPDLSSPDLLLSGGADYNDMCAGCHLKPGQSESDLSLGLYPAPPNFTLEEENGKHADDKQTELKKHFWVIKHGIKASGMPAWGKTHSDERIWAMVAFIQKLPEISPEAYQILTARGEAD